MSAQHDNYRTWAAWYRRAQHETENFTLNLSRLEDADLLALSQITEQWVTFIPQAFSFIHPAEHPKVRAACAYLTHLHERQAAAFQRRAIQYLNQEAEMSRILQSENRINETRSWLTRQA